MSSRMGRLPDWNRARYEHAWLLRAEGLTLREVGEHLGVCVERARQMITKFGRDVDARCARVKTTVRIER